MSERNLGFSGLLGASFFIGQVFSSYHWGASRTATAAGMLGLWRAAASFSSAVFGSCERDLGRHARVAGASPGLLVLTGVRDITDATNRPTAFSRSRGLRIGIVSACLEAPSRGRRRRPGVFGSEFWETYPHALPLLVCAVYQFSLVARVRSLARRAADGRVRRRRRRVDDVGAGLARRGLLSLAALSLAGAQILFDELFLSALAAAWRKPPRIGRFLALGGSSPSSGLRGAAVLRLSSGNASRVFVFCNLVNALGYRGAGAVVLCWVVSCVRVATRAQTIAFCQVMLLVSTSAPMSELGAVNGLGQTLAAAMGAWDHRRRVVVRGALARARQRRRGGHVRRHAPAYGARAFLVVTAIAAACALPTPRPPSMTSTTRSARTPTDGRCLRRRPRRKGGGDGLIVGERCFAPSFRGRARGSRIPQGILNLATCGCVPPSTRRAVTFVYSLKFRPREDRQAPGVHSGVESGYKATRLRSRRRPAMRAGATLLCWP